MKVKILGSSAPYCKDQRNCSGYLVINDGNKILLDCGFGITRNMKFPDDLNNLTIIISHLHKDHYSELFAIDYACSVYHAHNIFNGKVNVYIPSVLEGDKEYLDYLLIKNLQSSVFNIIEYNTSVNETSINDLKLEVLPNYHANMNSYSIKLSNDKILTYSGDMSKKAIGEFTEFAKDSSLLIIESSLLKNDRNLDTHLTTIEAATIAKESNSDKMIYTHMFPEINKEEYGKEIESIYSNAFPAKENDTIEI